MPDDVEVIESYNPDNDDKSDDFKPEVNVQKRRDTKAELENLKELNKKLQEQSDNDDDHDDENSKSSEPELLKAPDKKDDNDDDQGEGFFSSLQGSAEKRKQSDNYITEIQSLREVNEQLIKELDDKNEKSQGISGLENRLREKLVVNQSKNHTQKTVKECNRNIKV